MRCTVGFKLRTQQVLHLAGQGGLVECRECVVYTVIFMALTWNRQLQLSFLELSFEVRKVIGSRLLLPVNKRRSY